MRLRKKKPRIKIVIVSEDSTLESEIKVNVTQEMLDLGYKFIADLSALAIRQAKS